MEGCIMYGVMIWALLVNKLLGVVPPFLHMIIDVIGCLYIGSIYSLRYLHQSHPIKKPILMKSAFYYPFCATATLIAAYLLIRYLDLNIANTFLCIYFCILGVFALNDWIYCISNGILRNKYLQYGISISIVLAYWFTNHWILNNIIGIAFCIYAIHKIYICTFFRGALMLILFVIYDAYFVLESSVMTTVAVHVKAPIKLTYPPNALKGSFSYLGLGDIMIPGVFLAFCMRLDTKVVRGRYFASAIAGYIIGYIMSTATTMMSKKGVPALLFLIPSCLLSVIIRGFVEGDIMQIIKVDEERQFTISRY